MGNFFRKKILNELSSNGTLNKGEDSGLKRVLTVKDLTLMGVAAVVGGGIFSTIGAAAFNGGPGVILLFVITAITCVMQNLPPAFLLQEVRIHIHISVLVK